MSKRSWSPKDAAYYAEGGSLLRHYSNMRMTVITLGVTALLTIWTFMYIGSHSRTATLVLAVTGLMLFTFVFVLGVFFSSKYEQCRDHLVKLERGDQLYGPYTITTSRTRVRVVKLDLINWWIFGVGILLQAALAIVKLGLL